MKPGVDSGENNHNNKEGLENTQLASAGEPSSSKSKSSGDGFSRIIITLLLLNCGYLAYTSFFSPVAERPQAMPVVESASQSAPKTVPPYHPHLAKPAASQVSAKASPHSEGASSSPLGSSDSPWLSGVQNLPQQSLAQPGAPPQQQVEREGESVEMSEAQPAVPGAPRHLPVAHPKTSPGEPQPVTVEAPMPPSAPEVNDEVGQIDPAFPFLSAKERKELSSEKLQELRRLKDEDSRMINDYLFAADALTSLEANTDEIYAYDDLAQACARSNKFEEENRYVKLSFAAAQKELRSTLPDYYAYLCRSQPNLEAVKRKRAKANYQLALASIDRDLVASIGYFASVMEEFADRTPIKRDF